MRILLLATVALISFAQPTFALAAGDLAASTAGILDTGAFDWMVFNLRLKFVLLFFIMTAIAGLAQFASRARKDQHTGLVRVSVS
jgi:hypothetical protein